MPELPEIVEQAYAVFSGYRIGAELQVCRCAMCVSEHSERALVTTPLRQLSAAQLAEYTNSAHAFDTARVADQFRYFLPRYLELIAAFEPPCLHGYDVCLRRLGEADYRVMWPRAEADVINRFFDSFLEQCLAETAVYQTPSGWHLSFDIEEPVAMIAIASGDLERMFETWERAADPGAALHMAALRGSLMRVRREYWLDAPFLERHPQARQSIGAWLTSPRVTERIARVAAATAAGPFKDILERGRHLKP